MEKGSTLKFLGLEYNPITDTTPLRLKSDKE
jgi:hypothetical protein